MENKDNIEENLENIAPFLANIKKENHFSTPKNYFEVLPEVINNKKLNNKSLHFIFDKLSWRILVPVSSLVVVLIIIFNWNTTTPQINLTSEQISDYVINEEYINIDDYLIYDTYSEVLDEEKETSTNNNEYINYLIENDIDINSIIDEL